jgi:hypothetical protein
VLDRQIEMKVAKGYEGVETLAELKDATGVVVKNESEKHPRSFRRTIKNKSIGQFAAFICG